MKVKVRVFFAILFISSIGVVIYRGVRQTATCESTLVVECDPVFSKTMQEKVFAFAREQEKITVSPALLAHTLKETFPGVNDVVLCSSKPGLMHALITAYAPSAFINDTLLLLENGRVASVHDFEKLSHNALPRITFAPNLKVTDELARSYQWWKKRVDTTVYAAYDLCWYDDSYILFKDKNHSCISLIGSSETTINKELLALCEHVKQKILEKKINKGRSWFIDVRFTNQIVAFWQEGGSV